MLPAPGQELLVHVLNASELPVRIEIVLDEVERPLHSCRAVRVTLLVSYELETVALTEGHHLRGRHRVLARPGHDNDARVVEHAPGRGRAEVPQGLVEEQADTEAVPGRVDLGEDAPGEAEDQGGALQATKLPGHHDIVGRGVVLHLLSGREVVLAHSTYGGSPDAVLPGEGREGGVLDLDPLLLEQVLLHQHEIALATPAEVLDPFPVRVELTGTGRLRRIHGALPDDLAHGLAGVAHQPGDDPAPVALAMKPQDGGPGLSVQRQAHGSPLLPGGPRARSRSDPARDGPWPGWMPEGSVGPRWRPAWDEPGGSPLLGCGGP